MISNSGLNPHITNDLPTSGCSQIECTSKQKQELEQEAYQLDSESPGQRESLPCPTSLFLSRENVARPAPLSLVREFQRFKTAAPLIRESTIDGVSMSQKLVQEMADWSPGHSIENIQKAIEDLMGAIPTISDKNSLETIIKNIDQFEKIRTSKADTHRDLNALEDSVMELQLDIGVQITKLPGENKNESYDRIISLLHSILKKLDSFSIEQITNLIDKVALLERNLDGLSSNVQEQLSKTFADMNSKIDIKINHEINKVLQPHLVRDFKAILLDYLDEERSFNLLISKQDEINWDKSTQEVILFIFMQNFSLGNLPKLVKVIEGIRNGIKGLVDPNPSRAELIENQYYDMLQKQSLISTMRIYSNGIQTIIQGHRNNLTVAWETDDGLKGHGKITGLVEGLLEYTITIKKDDGTTVNMKSGFFSTGKFVWLVDGHEVQNDNITTNIPLGFVVFDHMIVRELYTNTSFNPTLIARGLLKDVSEAVNQVNRLKELRNVMGDRLFSHEEINKRFKLDVTLPRLSSNLNAELLNGPCPFETGKKIKETHFLFPISYFISNQGISWKAFVTHYGENSNWNGFSIREANVSSDSFPIQETNYSKAEWVLFYTGSVTQIPSEYQLASVENVITALSYWREREQAPLYLLELWPPPAQPRTGPVTKAYNLAAYFIYSDRISFDNFTSMGVHIAHGFWGDKKIVNRVF